MTTERTPYIPIDCEYHDALEAFATTRERVTIAFRNDGGETEQRDGTIVDVYARDGEEFLELDSGDRVRLDRLVDIRPVGQAGGAHTM